MAYETVLQLDARAIGELVDAIRAGSPASAHAYNNRRSEIQFDGRREFYSYGTHFPLARYVPASRRAPAVWIVNGDEWRGGGGGWHSSRTPDHQRVTREAIDAAGDTSIVLPFSAIAGAGIDFDTVRPIQVRPDANWTEYDALPDAVDIDALETATERRPFADTGGDVAGAAGVKYIWRREGREYTRTLYSRATVYTGESTPAGYPIHEWRDADAERFEADPIGAAVSSHAWLGGSREIVRRGDEWRAVRAVHRLGDSLFSAERVDPRTGERFRRAVYLSSFDYNERPPLYFLAEIPRNAGAVTVDAALDALAPRAVHAAYARAVDVRRQGDIFFIGTRQTRDALADAGATFARLTQWTRDAAPRAGEIGYRARLSTEARRRLAERERRARVREFRERFRACANRASAGYAGRDAETEAERVARRAATRERFAELFARHEAERDACRLAGVDTEAPESIACDTCGATIGETCRPFEALPEALPETLRRRIEAERERNAVMDSAGAVVAGFHMARRSTVATRQRTELSELRRETARRSATSARPSARANARRRYAAKRREAEAAVAAARESRRRAVFADRSTVRHYSYAGGPSYRETETDYRRRVRVSNIGQCRTNLARSIAEAEARRHARGAERDEYRRLYGNNAAACLVTARHNARVRYRPETVDGADEWRRRRERVRQVCAIYGTAHSATELARTRDGRVYVRGIVRHVPNLETGRDGARDHQPITLPADVWYLAIRNTVPRQRRRRTRSVST